MSELFRFPHTPHIDWLGEGEPRGDKLLAPHEVDELLADVVVVEEKIDGANLGFSTSEQGDLRCQNRGSYLTPGSGHEQFRPLWPWLAARREALIDALWPDRILFGEWCVAVHSVEYDRLPDWFLGFDVYDRAAGRFWSTDRRDALLADLGLTPVPHLARGRFTLAELPSLFGTSRVGTHPMEGLIIRRDAPPWSLARAKLVRPDFTQQITTHWSRAPLRRNRLAPDAFAG